MAFEQVYERNFSVMPIDTGVVPVSGAITTVVRPEGRGALLLLGVLAGATIFAASRRRA